MNDDTRRGDGGLTDFAGRLMRAGADVVTAGAERIREKGDDFPKASELLSGAAKLSARGKEEVVTLVANEVRNYMEKLRLGEELESFLEGHELQINVKLQPRRRPPKPDAAPPDEDEVPSESSE